MDVAYYPGCSLDGTAREYGESLEAVSRHLDVNLRELADWSCCGTSSAHITDDALALGLAARNLEIADHTGLDLLVPCAACYSRLKTGDHDIKQNPAGDFAPAHYKGEFQILHAGDFFNETVGLPAIADKVVKPLAGLKVVCYYGCLITRPPKVTGAADPDNPEAMDNIMAELGAEVKPWSFKTDCCGASHILTLPQVAYRMVAKLLDMAAEAGADAVVCGCPMCQSNLDSWQTDISRETGKTYEIPVFFFTELMGLAFGQPDTNKWLSRHAADPKPLLKSLNLL
jgi:heterodisulfide reductase subunit B2